MKMLRRVENEMFTFKIDSEIALVDCTSVTLGPTVRVEFKFKLLKEKEIFGSLILNKNAAICRLWQFCANFKTPQSKREMRASLSRGGWPGGPPQAACNLVRYLVQQGL
jgi:hypothetical protein